MKTLWLTLLLLCGPIGVLAGYLMGASLVSRGWDWRYAFYIQTISLVPVMISFLLTPIKYLDLENGAKQMQSTPPPPIPCDLVTPPAGPRTSFQYFGFS